jgi:hypothetical protein
MINRSSAGDNMAISDMPHIGSADTFSGRQRLLLLPNSKARQLVQHNTCCTSAGYNSLL